MKKKLLIHVLAMACITCSVMTSSSQSINVVPNPTTPDLFSWTGSGALSGYTGTPIVLNNALVLEYNATATSDPTQIVQQLAVYKGGDSLHLIPNPDAGQGVYLQSVQIIFNNLLFFIYLDVSGVQQLASFDGTSITVYPNPDAAGAGTGFVGSPRILNNTLYVAYVNVSGITQIGSFNGSGITLIPNPDASTVGFYNDYSVVFNNKIVSRYTTAAGPKQLASYDGTSWTLIPNPDLTPNHGFQPIFPTNYHNKLFWIYYGVGNQYQYAVYDGTNNPTLIANPQDGSSNNGGIAGLPIIFDDTLFFQYYNTSNILQLAKCDGASISLVPNPDATTYGFWNTPIVYNNNLYIFYLPVDGTHHLAQYQTNSNSLNVYPNPDGGYGYWDQPVVYNNNLYFMYYNASSIFQLGYFGGSSIKLVANPSGIYNGASGNNGYTGYPLIWNNLLYMQMGSIPYGDAGNLAFIDGSTLPITLLNFTAKQDGNTALLQWQVASEMNNAYFSVERSKDGTHFDSIGQVAGHGTIATEQKYQFQDRNPITGMNYYRLKQVDYDGNFTYSNIARVAFQGVSGVFNIYPNPALASVTVSLPSSEAVSAINVFDLSGKKVISQQVGAGVMSLSLNVTTLAAGIYHVTLLQGTQQQTIPLVKE